jgi:S-adenosylmethionine hydrolase
MSSYVNFYLRNGKTKQYSYLCGYSRSNIVYREFYETVGTNVRDDYCQELSLAQIQEIRYGIQNTIQKYRKNKADLEKCMREIGNWNNTMEEKMEYYAEWQSRIEDYEEEIDAAMFAENFYCVLEHICDYNPEGSVIVAGVDSYAYPGEDGESDGNA